MRGFSSSSIDGRPVDDRIDPVAELADIRFGRVAGVLAHLLVLEAERDFLDLGLERVDQLRFLVGERRGLDRNASQSGGVRSAEPGVERRPDPAEPGFGGRLGGEGLHLLAGEPLEDGDVEPAGRGVVREQIALDSAAGRNIGLFADQTGPPVGGAGRRLSASIVRISCCTPATRSMPMDRSRAR